MPSRLGGPDAARSVDDSHEYPHYLLDQNRRRLTPTFNNFPGIGAIEKRLLWLTSSS